MTTSSFVKIESLSLWSFDLDKLKGVLKSEGKIQRAAAKKLVARRAVSNAGENPGKDTGELARTISAKLFRNQLGVVITHNMKKDAVRYPFVLVHGRSAGNGYGAIAPRNDYIADVFVSRKAATTAALVSALKNSVKAKEIAL